MKFKVLFAAVMASMMALTVGCSKKNNTSSEEPAPEVVSEFAKGDNSHLSEAEKATDAIRFHYRRKDNDGTYACYRKWQIWAWDISNGGNGDAYTFDHYDDYGVYVDVTKDKVSGGKAMNIIGFIVAITSDWTKDPDGDRQVQVPETSHGGIYDIYLLTKSDKIYYDPESPMKNSIDYVVMNPEDRKKVNMAFSVGEQEFTFEKDKLFVEVNGARVSNYSVGDISATNRVIITFTEKIDWTKSLTILYQFDETWLDRCDMKVANYFDSEEFVNEFTYTGELGALLNDIVTPTATEFKVWAPTSASMKVNIYNTGDYRTETVPAATYDMTMGEKGVWSRVINDNLTGKYYTYTVTNSLGTHEVVDPYAKSAGVNGRRGMIVNFYQLNQDITGWDSDVRPNFGSSATDAIVYEAHVRDMTINPNSGVSASHRGKFIGLAETGTKYTEDPSVSTGLDHVKELGITHVQLQPFFDYNSVDETQDTTVMSKENYNWGYDPQNYNVLEGSYSTNPVDGENRIREFKQMVMAMHEQGLSINMDVVYNHTGASEASNFNYLVPNFYYRTTGRGVFYNGSGCGNEFACDRAMGRKFVVDSCKFWIDEYHLSGFRFDLMGLMDNQTMIDIYNECHNLYNNIMVYGEPWTGGSSKLESGNDASKLSKQQTVQSSLNQSYFVGNNVLVGAFNDQIRNAVRGDNNPSSGLVQGSSSSSSMAAVSAGMRGMFNTSDNKVSPQQVINYVSCHDNYTLYDQIIQTKGSRDVNHMYSQAEAAVIFSEGVPFMQEGEEFMRSKAYEKDGSIVYEGNSYKAGDFINNMDYSLKVTNAEMVEKFKEMIALRKAISEFRLSTREEVRTAAYNVIVNQNTGVARYSLHSTDGDLTVYHAFKAANFASVNGTIIFDNFGEMSGAFEGTLELAANQTVIVRAAIA